VLAFSFITFLPLQFGTSLAASTITLPGWLRAWADVNPVTHVMDACRALLNGPPVGHAVGASLIWCLVLFMVFCPLAVRVYSRRP
jgi:oleandomycin transport system permease protein